MVGATVPSLPTKTAVRVKTVWSPVSVMLHETPEAVPLWVISEGVKMLAMIGSENVAVKRIGTALVGSA